MRKNLEFIESNSLMTSLINYIIFEWNNIFKRILFVPNQKALKLVLSVINKIFPLPLLITLNGVAFFNSDRFSSEMYPLIRGLDE